MRHTTQPCSDRCICHMLASSSAVNLFLLHTTHERDPMQTELASAKAQLQEADAERAALRSQADELSGELDWCVRDLFRLKQLEISSRCLDWLDGAEGLSTVRAHTQHAASAAEPTASAARGHTPVLVAARSCVARVMIAALRSHLPCARCTQRRAFVRTHQCSAPEGSGTCRPHAHRGRAPGSRGAMHRALHQRSPPHRRPRARCIPLAAARRAPAPGVAAAAAALHALAGARGALGAGAAGRAGGVCACCGRSAERRRRAP